MTEHVSTPEKYFHAFKGSDVEVPPLPHDLFPIPAELWLPFVDQVVPVTFTVIVPLSVVVEGKVSLESYVAGVFANQVVPWDVAYRAVGEASSNEEFEGDFVGDIRLQIHCTLQSV